jgi:hypothetical protein
VQAKLAIPLHTVLVLETSLCQTSPVIVSVTVKLSVLTTNSPESALSPDGNLVPSQLSLEPSQQIEFAGQSWVLAQAMPYHGDGTQEPLMQSWSAVHAGLQVTKVLSPVPIAPPEPATPQLAVHGTGAIYEATQVPPLQESEPRHASLRFESQASPNFFFSTQVPDTQRA